MTLSPSTGAGTPPGEAPPSAPAAADAVRAPFPEVRRVGPGAPFRWLAHGARDFRDRPLPSLFYGVCFAAMGWLLGALLRPAPGTMMAMTAGFLLVGPFMAMGLYEVARRAEAGLPCRLSATTVAWRRNLSNIAILGIGMGVLLALWARSSMMVIAIFFPRRMPSVAILLDEIARGENVGFIATWLGVGAAFATLVFAFTAVAIPLMLDRGTDAITAMLASAQAFGRNLVPMAIWAALIVSLTGVGFATLFVGLIVTVPWIGLATWHAYRDLVAPAPGSA
ncbi:MAG: DUF2189 domain-containing protein [Burkholderiales bacterium]|nr:DUF2189 domain-containing protein [Burkholderiales bacterium]